MADVTGLQGAIDSRLGTTGGNVAGDIDLNYVAGNHRGIHWKTAAGNRRFAFANGTTETGGNAGSDFSIARFDDKGAYIDNQFTIARTRDRPRIAQVRDRGRRDQSQCQGIARDLRNRSRSTRGGDGRTQPYAAKQGDRDLYARARPARPLPRDP
jgi:hypothetical protein